MFKGSKGRHRKPRVPWVSPLFALEAALVQLRGTRELESASAVQLAEMAQS